MENEKRLTFVTFGYFSFNWYEIWLVGIIYVYKFDWMWTLTFGDLFWPFGDLYSFFTEFIWNLVCRDNLHLQIRPNVQIDHWGPFLTFWWPLVILQKLISNLFFGYNLYIQIRPHIRMELRWPFLTFWWTLVIFQQIYMKFGT